jgi:membrane-bound ClpP family serine protease
LESNRNQFASLINPLSKYKYKINEGKVEKVELPFSFVYWLKEQIVLWWLLALFLSAVFYLSQYNSYYAHNALTWLGVPIGVVGLLFLFDSLSHPYWNVMSKIIGPLPFLLLGLLAIVESEKPEWIFAQHQTSEVKEVSDIRSMSDGSKSLLIIGSEEYVVSGGEIAVGNKVTVKKYYFDSKMKDIAVVRLCRQADECIKGDLLD